MLTPSDQISAACPRLLIGALRGSSGKTLLAMGLLQAWRARGLSVAPFKKGPDYIDAAWLSRAAGIPCRNIDTYLMTDEVIRRSVGEHGRGADVTLIEGNHGLYDGVGAEATASAAEVAKLLRAPVLLLVECTKATRTVAAMVLGCQHMDPELRVAGVILNRVATPRQEKAIRTAVEEICGLPVLGSIPRLPDLALPERHLGLLTPAEHPEVTQPVIAARQTVEAHVDVEAIRTLAATAEPLCWSPRDREPAVTGAGQQMRIGIVRDSAFTFYYPENLEALRHLGADLVDVNALTDADLPPIDALYIGGGYPETHAAALARNESFRRSLRRQIDAGLPVIAECGGLIYLGDAIVLDGIAHPMVGVFPVTFELGKRPWGHGYACADVAGPNPFFPEGTALRGHEFRYSYVRSMDSRALRFAFRMTRGRGFNDQWDGLVYKNVLASFCHLHALGSPGWAEGVLRQARSWRTRRGTEAWTDPVGGRPEVPGVQPRPATLAGVV
ncbi:MAG TPA: cobyrinate a,c-diamide synthase [Candidatus Acidoferrum sp.]|nr:cobyrinate a,c-diamide synthase [Candidatus Acidoferrum sp.]